jgi:hypothetical protein
VVVIIVVVIIVVVIVVMVVVVVIIVLFAFRTMSFPHTNLFPLLTTSHSILPSKARLSPLGTTMLLSRLWMFTLDLIFPTMEVGLLLLAVGIVLVNYTLLAVRAAADAVFDTVAGLGEFRAAVAGTGFRVFAAGLISAAFNLVGRFSK